MSVRSILRFPPARIVFWNDGSDRYVTIVYFSEDCIVVRDYTVQRTFYFNKAANAFVSAELRATLQL